MTTHTQTQSKTLKARAQELINAGKKRTVVAQTKGGRMILNANLNLVLGVLAFLLLIGFVSIPILLIAAFFAVFFGVKVEVLFDDGANEANDRLSIFNTVVGEAEAHESRLVDEETEMWNG